MTFNYDNISTPWLDSYGEVPCHLDYSDRSMSGTVLETAAADPDFPALSFMGRRIPYRTFAEEIDRTARAFFALGIRPGDRVLVCLPNVPQAIYCLYGLNRIGAVPSMVHPLSAVGEIVHYIEEASCEVARRLLKNPKVSTYKNFGTAMLRHRSSTPTITQRWTSYYGLPTKI